MASETATGIIYSQLPLLARVCYNIDRELGHQRVNSANKVRLRVKWQASYDDGVYSLRQVCVYSVVDKEGEGLSAKSPPPPAMPTA